MVNAKLAKLINQFVFINDAAIKVTVVRRVEISCSSNLTLSCCVLFLAPKNATLSQVAIKIQVAVNLC